MSNPYLDFLTGMVNPPKELTQREKEMLELFKTDTACVTVTATGRRIHSTFERLEDYRRLFTMEYGSHHRGASKTFAINKEWEDFSGSIDALRFTLDPRLMVIIDDIGQLPPLKFWDDVATDVVLPKSSHRINHKGKGPRNKWGAHK